MIKILIVQENGPACALGLVQPIHDGRWGVKTVACCAALLESSRTGSEIAPTAMIIDTLEAVSV